MRLLRAVGWTPALAVGLTLALAGCPPPSAVPNSDPTPEPTPEPPPCAPPEGAPGLDSWGGDLRVSLPATGFFHLTKVCGRDWFVDPEGHPMRSFGVNSAGPTGDLDQESGRRPYGESIDALYASDEEWADAATTRLRSWGLNTAGSWSSVALLAPRIATTRDLRLSGGWFEWADQPPGGRFDGENNNWGLVGLDDAPWAELTAAMATVTAEGANDLRVPDPAE